MSLFQKKQGIFCLSILNSIYCYKVIFCIHSVIFIFPLLSRAEVSRYFDILGKYEKVEIVSVSYKGIQIMHSTGVAIITDKDLSDSEKKLLQKELIQYQELNANWQRGQENRAEKQRLKQKQDTEAVQKALNEAQGKDSQNALLILQNAEKQYPGAENIQDLRESIIKLKNTISAEKLLKQKQDTEAVQNALTEKEKQRLKQKQDTKAVRNALNDARTIYFTKAENALLILQNAEKQYPDAKNIQDLRESINAVKEKTPLKQEQDTDAVQKALNNAKEIHPANALLILQNAEKQYPRDKDIKDLKEAINTVKEKILLKQKQDTEAVQKALNNAQGKDSKNALLILQTAEEQYSDAKNIQVLRLAIINLKNTIEEKGAAIIKDLREAAEQDDAVAQRTIGRFYDAGIIVPQDDEEAVKWFRMAAEQGDPKAQCKLGFCYVYGTGVNEDAAEGVKWFRMAAEQGFPDAQCNLGACYVSGRGFAPKNVEEFANLKIEGVKWFHKAAAQGDAVAQCNLSICYNLGDGVTRNNVESLKWTIMAAEQGFAPSQFDLSVYYSKGIVVTQNKAEADKWTKKYLDSQRFFLPCYFGAYLVNTEVIKNDAEIVKWLSKAAEQENAEAQYNLGLCYAKGTGVNQNDAEAVKWCLKATEQGNAAAQRYLGVCYENGLGVNRDDAEAVKWYRKAAEQGDARAQYYLGGRYNRGRGVTENDTEAVKWYRKAAEQGDEDAIKALRQMEI